MGRSGGRFAKAGWLAAISLAAIAAPAAAKPVLLISVDGLRPGDVLDADARGLKVPTLRKLAAEGSHATGVKGILPTFTLPSHASLVTGVSPARHGVPNNLTFRPSDAGGAPGYNLASLIKAPTLWDAAHAKGIATASINWPVSLGSRSIDSNISTFFVGPGTTQDDDRYNRLLSTPGLVERIEKAIGPVTLTARHGAADEEQDLRIVEQVVKDGKPGFVTVHFGALDEAEHEYGPGSAEAKAALEIIDGYIGRLVATARTVQPDIAVAVVSDHGFTAVTREVNLPKAFVDAGLIRVDGGGKVAGWDAAPWAAGGSAAVILARPDDAALQAKVAKLLAALKADPANGMEEVYDAPELAKRGGFPGANFGISYRLDTTGPAARPLSQPLVAPAVQKGTHGHAASHPELYSTFIIAGPGIARGRDLGVIDLRAIAPTLATLIGVSLPDAEQPALSLTAP
ncbi:MAG: ectonucleotide pyrophosphatase/phosphodiesterase [Sphingobium sp.]